MAEWLKHGREAAAQASADAQVRASWRVFWPTSKIATMKLCGCFPSNFGKWDRADYRLTDAEIETAINAPLAARPCWMANSSSALPRAWNRAHDAA